MMHIPAACKEVFQLVGVRDEWRFGPASRLDDFCRIPGGGTA